MNYSQHDELAQLFAQQMQLSQMAAVVQQQQQSQPVVHVEHVPQLGAKANDPVAFVSGHYTGTAHLRPDTTSEPSRSPPPTYHEALVPEAMADILREHSIDPASLLPNQAHLFANADYEQRLRLLELWRIAPPSYPLEEHLHSQRKWEPTSVAREEAEARNRYEQLQQRQMQQPPSLHIPSQHIHRRAAEEHMLDTHIVEEPISPIREPGEAAWPPAARMRAASIASNWNRSRPVTVHVDSTTEPYIADGYQQAQAQAQAQAQTQALDPVYAAATGLWQAPTCAAAVQTSGFNVEDQYGMYEQIRNHADWEAMNERVARERMMGLHQAAGMDDEMVM